MNFSILDNVEVRAESSSSFTPQIVNDRLATLHTDLLSINLGLESATRTRSIEQEIEYLEAVKLKKGW